MRTRISVGVAIGIDSIAASWRVRGGTTEWSASLVHDGHTTPSAEILRSAFADLRVRLPAVARITLAIAILPPLARVRRIELPRMTDDERRLAVSRAAERHFVGLAESVVCSIERCKSRSAVVPFLATAVSGAFIEDLEQVAREFGWSVDRFVPAHAAWTRAGMKQWRVLRQGDGRLVVAGTRETTTLMMRGGALSVVRRFRGSATLPHDGTASRSFNLGDGNRSAALIAAGAARRTRLLRLIPEATRQARSEAQLRLTQWLLYAAAACLVAAGGMHRWGLSRHLNAIAVQRNALRSRVNMVVAARDTLDQLLRSVNAIQSLARSAPHLSFAIARIAVALPQDASLTTLRADGDSISLDGQAGDAAPVFAAFRSAPGLLDVRATAPIRQELAAGDSSIERWTIALRVARNAAKGDR